MENSQKPNTNVTTRQMKNMLKHKLASLLTQQKLKEKAQKEMAEKSKSSIIAENNDTVQPPLNAAI